MNFKEVEVKNIFSEIIDNLLIVIENENKVLQSVEGWSGLWDKIAWSNILLHFDENQNPKYIKNEKIKVFQGQVPFP